MLLALALVFAVQEPGFLPPAPLVSRNIQVQVPIIRAPYDVSYLTLTKRLQLWKIFTPEVQKQFFIADKKNLMTAWNHNDLVNVVDIAPEIGVVVRTSGHFPIAEREKKLTDRHYYYGVRPAAAGLLVRITQHMQECEGTAYTPLVLTSLVRSWEYQKLLMKVNPTANVLKQGVPPTHVFGLAFDITRVGLSKARQDVLESYLQELASEGVAIYFKESNPQAAFHVIALPQAHVELTTYFDSLVPTHTAPAGSR